MSLLLFAIAGSAVLLSLAIGRAHPEHALALTIAAMLALALEVNP